MNFKKTFWMNLVLTVLWILFSALAFSLLPLEHGGKDLLVKGAIFYSCLIAVPLVNTFSLKWSECAKLNVLARIGNWCAIGCTMIYYGIVTFYLYPNIFSTFDIVVYPITFLAFILPSLITLKALRISSRI